MAAAAAIMHAQPMQNSPDEDHHSHHHHTAHRQPQQELPRPYKCPMCDKAFHRLEHQTRHIRTHTGEKPHACLFPGCSKRFSRSDELTRHSRIHNNPNSRRGKLSQTAAAASSSAAAAMATSSSGLPPPAQQLPGVMGPPAFSPSAAASSSSSYSGPASRLVSPNVSPPYMYNSRPVVHSSSQTSPYGSYSTGGSSPEGHFHPINSHTANMNLLATAASHVARESDTSSYSSPPSASRGLANHVHMHHPQAYSSHPRHHPYDRTSHVSHHSSRASDLASRGSGTGLAAYHLSQNQSGPHLASHSMAHAEDDHYAHRMAKRSRPGSPYSTNPPSPTFSNTSYSPTPGHTPAMTPAHSPRMRAKHAYYADKDNNQLPGIRSLSLHQPQHTPALEPLEPSADTSAGGQVYTPYSRSQNSSSTGLRITDIINREDGAARKLPIPTPPGVDMVDISLPGANSFTASGHSSVMRDLTGSSSGGSGGEWPERR